MPQDLYAPKPADKSGEDKPAADKLVGKYWREIERYKRATSQWTDEGTEIERLYLDEDRTAAGSSSRRFALLWANIETLKPAVYAKPPVVLCSRRYKDRDPIARIAAELMERATNTSFDLYNAHETFEMVRDDRLLPGRGQAWVRYEATIDQYDDSEDDDEAEDAPPAPSPVAGLPGGPALDADAPPMREKLSEERVCTDYVHWQDFGHNIAGAWNDVWLVWRAVYKTKEEVGERFGKEMAEKLNYDAKAPASISDRASAPIMGEPAEDFCRIIEIWDKRRRLVSWITESLTGQFIETGEPPVNFSGFFPCPRPCYATKTSRSLVPRADYVYYKDQAREINDLTAKIAVMMQWLVIKGFVPGGPSRIADSIEQVIREKSNRELFVEVESFTEFTEKGGIAKLIDWFPVDIIIKTIQAAIQARNQLIQDVFQITGLSDILRGQTDPTETLGAQELKAQTGSRRLRNTKDELARFCRDVARLNAEVIAEKFEPETIAAITGYRYVPEQLTPPKPGIEAIGANGGPPIMPPVPMAMQGGAPQMQPPMPNMQMPPAPAAPAPVAPAPMGQDQQSENMTFDDRVIRLLRDDRLRSFRVDVETDSTAQADEQAEKQNRTEFLNATGGYMEKAVAAITQAPQLASAMGEMLMFAVRGFRAGRTVEEEIERSFSAMAQQAAAAAQQPAQPTPEELKAKADADAAQQKMALAQQQHDQAMQAAQMQLDAELAISNAKMVLIEQQQAMAADEHMRRMAEMDKQAELKREEAAFKRQEAIDNADARHEDQAYQAAERAQQASEPKE